MRIKVRWRTFAVIDTSSIVKAAGWNIRFLSMSEPGGGMEDRRRGDEVSGGPLFVMKPQRVPAYWQCIRLVPKPDYAGVDQADFNPATMAASSVCLACGEGIKYVPGGNAAVDHMKLKHRDMLLSYSSPSPKKKKKAKRRKSSEGGKARRDLSEEERDQVKKALAKWIARRMRPMSIVEDEELQDLCDLLGDFGGFNIDLPGRTQIRQAIVEDASELRSKLKKELESHTGYYCLTTDIWTDRSARSYMSLTIHYVDDQFIPHNKLLGVVHFPGKHDGVRIGAKLVELLDEWSLDKDKCAMLIRDGAGNAVKGARCSGLPNMSCIAHALQLVLAGGMMRARKPAKPKAKGKRKGRTKTSHTTPSEGSLNEHAPASPQTAPGRNSTASEDGSGDAEQEYEDMEFIEESETDSDDDIADNAVDYQAIRQLRVDARGEIDRHIATNAYASTKRALDRIRGKVAKFRRVATYFHRSPKAKYRLGRLQQAKNNPLLSLILDCPTRWSSTHAMLQRFDKIKSDVDAFFAHLATSTGVLEFSDGVLTESLSREDWFYVQCLCKILEPFASVTTRLSGEQYPTFVRAFPYLRMLKTYLQRDNLFEDAYSKVKNEPFARQALREMKDVCKAFLQLFIERFAGMDRDLMWVPVLDPRLNDMPYLSPGEKDRARDCLIAAMIEIEEDEENVRAKANGTSTTPPALQSTMFSPPRVTRSVIDEFDDYLYGPKSPPSASTSEADKNAQRFTACTAEALRYIGWKDKPDQQPLEWWRENGYLFPTISKVARKWLGCVATSVPSERAFSTGGNVVTVKRAALTPDMVENLVMIAHNAKEKHSAEGAPSRSNEQNF